MNATKFTFDTIFSADLDTVSGAARSRRRRTLSESEIERLCAEARAEGVRAGEVAALEAIASAASEAAKSVSHAVRQIASERQALQEQAAGLALAMARKLAQAALAAFPQADVEAALREAMHQALGEPRLVLKAAPHVAEAIAPRIAEIAHEQAFDGRIQVSADASLKRADCRIEWRGGGAERAEAALERALEELIARNFASAATAMNGEGSGHGQQ